MIAIDSMTPGSPPAGFSFARTGQGREGEWIVTSDTTSSTGKVIEQTSTDRTDYRFPLAIHESLSATNVDVEVRFKAVAGKTDQAGGIAVRLRDADIITSPAPMRWKITFGSIASSRAGANNWMVPI